jgi:DNA-binding MarR family transcriptional regulator
MLSKIEEKILIKIAEENSNNIYNLSKDLGNSYSTTFDNIKKLEEEGYLSKTIENETIKKAKMTLTQKGLIYVFSLLNKNDLSKFKRIIQNYKNAYFKEILNSKIFEKESIESFLFLKSIADLSIPFLEDIKEEEKKLIEFIFYANCFSSFLLFPKNSKIFKKLKEDKNFKEACLNFQKKIEEAISIFNANISLINKFLKRNFDFSFLYQLGFQNEKEIRDFLNSIIKNSIGFIFYFFRDSFSKEKEIINIK